MQKIRGMKEADSIKGVDGKFKGPCVQSMKGTMVRYGGF